MDKTWIKEQIDTLQLEQLIELKDIPNIDLYMDQLITLFEDKLNHTKRNPEDKLLTKTMINNYTKDKVLMPAVKKKYTKDHIILMILLYQLKGIVSIGDIKDIFSMIKNEQDDILHEQLEVLYNAYYEARQQEIKQFNEAVVQRVEMIQNQLEVEDNDFKEVLLTMLLIEQASYHKRLAEKLIDERIKSKNTTK